jgi:phosphoribosylformimino-5-aminoimidazole carboxamide ribotide isomerase
MIDDWLTDYRSKENLIFLAQFCDEFLVHGVDVEGKKCGIEEPLVTLLGECCPVPVTYGESLIVVLILILILIQHYR